MKSLLKKTTKNEHRIRIKDINIIWRVE